MAEGTDQLGNGGEKNRRAAPRSDVWIAFDIDGRPTPRGDSVDHLSMTGCFIRTVEPLAPKTRVVIRMTAPESEQRFRFDGEVIRTITPEEAPRLGSAPGMAIEFLDLGAGDPRPMAQQIIDEVDRLEDARRAAKEREQFGATPEDALESFLASAQEANYYAVLGVGDPSADRRALRKAYYRRCKRFHPDRFRDAGPTVRARAEEAYQLLTEAYETLSDPERRVEYDAEHGVHETVVARRATTRKRVEAAIEAEKNGRAVRALIEAKLALAIDPREPDALALVNRLQTNQALFLT